MCCGDHTITHTHVQHHPTSTHTHTQKQTPKQRTKKNKKKLRERVCVSFGFRPGVRSMRTCWRPGAGRRTGEYACGTPATASASTKSTPSRRSHPFPRAQPTSAMRRVGGRARGSLSSRCTCSCNSHPPTSKRAFFLFIRRAQEHKSTRQKHTGRQRHTRRHAASAAAAAHFQPSRETFRERSEIVVSNSGGWTRE